MYTFTACCGEPLFRPKLTFHIIISHTFSRDCPFNSFVLNKIGHIFSPPLIDLVAMKFVLLPVHSYFT
jgi:hypothetical protein